MAPNSHDISNDNVGIARRNDTKDALIVLYLLSKGVSVLETVRNGQPGSMSTTYQINPPLD
ncbi:MAG: hypothetical protein ACTHKP_03985 [Nitrososphaeraceae archaeon]